MIMAHLFAGGVMAGNSLKLYFDNSSFNLKLGEKKSIKLMADTGNVYLSGINLAVKFSTNIKVNSVTVHNNNFSTVTSAKTVNGEVVMVAYNMGKFTNQLPKGVVEIGSLEIEGVSVGQVDFSLSTNQMIGNDGANNIDYFGVNFVKPTVSVEAVTIPTPTGIIGNGKDGVLKFKVAFAGVTNGAACAVNWPVDVMVLENNGNSKTYSGIDLNNEREGQMLLTGINSKNNLAVFIKGPKHVQVKYAENNQNNFYNKPGGNIIVDSNPENTVVYNFTGYPLMAGDINRDGVVDGVDFSIVKSEVNKRTEGNDLASDLNGNCKLESQDLSLLMLAMKDKQEQLY